MEKVISLLYDIEEKANQIVKLAAEEKASLCKNAEIEMEKLDQSISDDYTIKLNTLKVQVDTDLQNELQLLLNDCDKQIAAMQLHFNQNHHDIADKIFLSIIGP